MGLLGGRVAEQLAELVEGELLISLLERLRFLTAQIEFGLLIALLVVNLLDPVFLQVGPIDGLGIVVGDVGGL